MAQQKFPDGFTLPEFIFVVVILLIMAGGVSGAMRSFSDTVSTQNTLGYLGDIVHKLSNETVLGEYQKTSVFFNSFHVLADSTTGLPGPTLSWDKITKDNNVFSGCTPGDIKLAAGVASTLFQLTPKGQLLAPTENLAAGDFLCFDPRFDPLEHEEREVIYELRKDSEFSNRIRIFPINPDDNGNNDVLLHNDYRLEILGPYGKKRLYKGNISVDEGNDYVISIKSGESEAIYYLPKK